MLKITDNPQYEDFENTDELLEMFRHAIHSEFALNWISGLLAHLDVERMENKALRKSIAIWLDEHDGDIDEFKDLYEKMDSATFAIEMAKKVLGRGCDSDVI